MSVPILSDIFGTKPDIAPYVPTEFGPEQIKALKENIEAFPWINQLGDIFQSYMTDAFNTAIPGFSDILKMGGKLTEQMQSTAAEELSGKIPKDVQEAVQRSSAFQNLMSGGGGAMADANSARNYGLTSLDMIGKGAQLQETAGNAAQRWAGLASNLIMNPAGYLVTPAQQVQLTMSNRLHQQATQQLKNNVNAAPDPIAKGLSDIVETLTAAYLGGKVGGPIGAGNAAATAAATPGPGMSDVSNPGYVVQGGGGGGSIAGDFYNGYGGISPSYNGIGSNPWDTGNVSLTMSGQPDNAFLANSPTGTSDFLTNTNLWNTSGVPQGNSAFNFGG